MLYRFKFKYHPEDSTKRQTEQHEGLTKRLEVFQEMISSELMEKVALDVDQSENIVRLLDSGMISLFLLSHNHSLLNLQMPPCI